MLKKNRRARKTTLKHPKASVALPLLRVPRSMHMGNLELLIILTVLQNKPAVLFGGGTMRHTCHMQQLQKQKRQGYDY